MRIFNIGSLNIDRVYRVADFVHPGETIKALSYAECAGGKGLNQSVAAARAGAEVLHVGAVGSDGDCLVDLLVRAGADTRFVERVDGPTGHAVIQVTDVGENDIVICGGANDCLSCDLIDRTLQEAVPGDLVLLQNETANLAYALERAGKRGCRIVLNPSPINESLLGLNLSAVDVFILNEYEGAALAGMSADAPAEQVASELLRRYPRAVFMMTLGGNGCCYAAQGTRILCGSYGMDPVDTTGAGDTFCGYFLAGLTQGADVEDLLVRASAASSIAITRNGAAQSIPSASEVDAFIGQKGRPDVRTCA